MGSLFGKIKSMFDADVKEVASKNAQPEVKSEKTLSDEEREKLDKIQKALQENIISDHVGLLNVSRRLKLFYGDKARLTIESKEEHGTIVRIYIPISSLKRTEQLNNNATC